MRGRQLQPLVGDRVDIVALEDGTWVVTAIADRKTLLQRINARGRAEGLAANVSLLAIVVAPEPTPDWRLVDRYLVAAELAGCRGLVVWNKADLSPVSSSQDADILANIGYSVVESSAKTATGLTALKRILAGELGVLVGQSGVGKSSLMNALVGQAAHTVGALSDKSTLGRHTTTATRLYHLPDGGELIDSPGVRRFAPYLENDGSLDWAFTEFRSWLGHCRYDNCAHIAEPGCQVKQAVATGTIARSRYDSYLDMRDTLAAIAQ